MATPAICEYLRLLLNLRFESSTYHFFGAYQPVSWSKFHMGRTCVAQGREWPAEAEAVQGLNVPTHCVIH